MLVIDLLDIDTSLIKQLCDFSQPVLCVTFDLTLCFDQHIKEITQTTFFHLHNKAKMRSFLSTADAETLIHVFVSSRLGYRRQQYCS